MRVWLVEDTGGVQLPGLADQLAQLSIHLLGRAPYRSDFNEAMRTLLPDLLELLVVHEPAWPEEACLDSVLEAGAAAVIVARPDKLARFRGLAGQFALVFAPAPVTVDGLQVALENALLARRRQAHWQSQLRAIEQRLTDRIITERAKGILMERLRIPEAEAYRRLRLLSRRQRRPIRELAQELLDVPSATLASYTSHFECVGRTDVLTQLREV